MHKFVEALFIVAKHWKQPTYIIKDIKYCTSKMKYYTVIKKNEEITDTE
jgi:hypothetical protein